MMDAVDEKLGKLLRDVFDAAPRGGSTPDFSRAIVHRARASDWPILSRGALSLLVLGFCAACAALAALAPGILTELGEGILFWLAG